MVLEQRGHKNTGQQTHEASEDGELLHTLRSTF
jgi:hypothetical protein